MCQLSRPTQMDEGNVRVHETGFVRERDGTSREGRTWKGLSPPPPPSARAATAERRRCAALRLIASRGLLRCTLSCCGLRPARGDRLSADGQRAGLGSEAVHTHRPSGETCSGAVGRAPATACVAKRVPRPAAHCENAKGMPLQPAVPAPASAMTAIVQRAVASPREGMPFDRRSG